MSFFEDFIMIQYVNYERFYYYRKKTIVFKDFIMIENSNISIFNISALQLLPKKCKCGYLTKYEHFYLAVFS